MRGTEYSDSNLCALYRAVRFDVQRRYGLAIIVRGTSDFRTKV